MIDYFLLNELNPAVLNHFDTVGYWLVEDHKVFINKPSALVYCSQHKTNYIKYIFQQKTFNNVDWTKEPDESVTDLYKIRAEQIRDQYDYVILAYSGGSDSTAMLHSFIDNGIFPDEVVSFVFEGKDFNNVDFAPNSEIYYNFDTIENLVIKNSIKFTRMDYSNLYKKYFGNDHWNFSHNELRASANIQGRAIQDKKFTQLVDQGKKTCIVYGIDKPRLTVDNCNNVCAFFQDSICTAFTNNDTFNIDTNLPTIERFYISENFPALTIKQSHMLCRALQDNILHFNFKHQDYNLIKQISNDVLYGHCYNQYTKFSLGKQTTIYGYKDNWIWKLDNHDLRKKNILQGWQKLRQNIDTNWTNNFDLNFNFKGCISDLYPLGIKIG